ncbi:hypothetical protein GcM1_03515 [Golovinomyces cichoracearum]|uniref:Uncharacterized protein n=1 Tax=Golovinomyces cichoracearum TaxID=62708 RepID=A0A420IQF9_9PEZI|nr:hypothetical protein GcM1_03515 [Golovinomyces cichoracearum]
MKWLICTIVLSFFIVLTSSSTETSATCIIENYPREKVPVTSNQISKYFVEACDKLRISRKRCYNIAKCFGRKKAQNLGPDLEPYNHHLAENKKNLVYKAKMNTRFGFLRYFQIYRTWFL